MPSCGLQGLQGAGQTSCGVDEESISTGSFLRGLCFPEECDHILRWWERKKEAALLCFLATSIVNSCNTKNKIKKALGRDPSTATAQHSCSCRPMALPAQLQPLPPSFVLGEHQATEWRPQVRGRDRESPSHLRAWGTHRGMQDRGVRSLS